MKNFNFEICNFNPKEASDEENDMFTNCCKYLFDREERFSRELFHVNKK